MSKTFDHFITEVDEALSDLTGGNFDLSVLPDYAEGENALSDMFFEGLTPRAAARRKMFAEGMEDALNCWSDECDDCEFEGDCPHIG